MEDKERNSNVILLIVIAIATMIIVVIGATFAYLATVADDHDVANVNAGFQEGESDLLLIDAGKTLNVEATFDNFGKGEGDQVDYGMAKVILQASPDNPSEHNYDVFLETEANDMVYTAGTCYKKTAAVAGATDKAGCGANAWARVNGATDAACYEPAVEKVEGKLYESERGCLTSDDNMWVIDDKVAELAFDIYKPDATVTTAADCTNKGVCIDKQRKISTTITTADACSSDDGYTWTPNYFDDATGKCFKVDQSVDITTAPVGKIKLYSNETIQANAGTTTSHEYMVAVVLVNLPHNQIANGGHKYVGRLNISKVTEPEASPTPTE